MVALIQRVSRASVTVSGSLIANIGAGLLVLLAVEKGDGAQDVNRMAERLASYRVFSDPQGKMNLSVADIKGEILLVPQFTLAADTKKGLRPSFHTAAAPDIGQQLFADMVTALQAQQQRVQQGQFGADMQVELINDGPVTFYLKSSA